MKRRCIVRQFSTEKGYQFVCFLSNVLKVKDELMWLSRQDVIRPYTS